jgi:uncharacterized protein YdhG (YjbR/CyaY superfamily)
MQSKATTVDEYINELPEERKEAIKKLRSVFKKNLPKGFQEVIGYGMIGYVVPHSIFPAGYHCNPSLPLPFVNIASQKNYIAVHHMGIYANPKLLKWFVDEYPKHSVTKLDMGKACIKFKKLETIPFKLLEELAAKITVEEWIECCTSILKKK